MFASPLNRAAVMNSPAARPTGRRCGDDDDVPERRAGAVDRRVLHRHHPGPGLSLPSHLYAGLVAQGVPAGTARSVAGLPPVGNLFASFLSYNRIRQLIPASRPGPSDPHGHAAYLTGRSFFPQVSSAPPSRHRTALRLRLIAIVLLADVPRGVPCSSGAAATCMARIKGRTSESWSRLRLERKRPRRPHVEVAQGV